MKIEVRKRIEIGDKIIERSCSAETIYDQSPERQRDYIEKLATALLDSIESSEGKPNE